MPTQIEQAVQLLQTGGVVAIPTETVYGLAACADQPDAIRKIFKAKNRPENHPLILHIANKKDLALYAKNIPSYVDALIQHFWPGPLTIILKKTDLVSPVLTGGNDTVGIRMPAHPIALEIIQRTGPLVAPSANQFGKISPTTAEHVRQDLGDSVDLIIDGGRCIIGIESTIIDATNPDHAIIVRQGLLSASDFNEVLGSNLVNTTLDSSISAPGNLKSHYCPEKPLKLFSNQKELDLISEKYHHNCYVLPLSLAVKNFQYTFQMPNDSADYAYQLYFQLRIADGSDVAMIAIEPPPDTEIWGGVLERLKKASANH